jgi:hypothetical protein
VVLGRKQQTVGNTIQYFVDYWQAIKDGYAISSATVTSSSADTTITSVTVLEGHVVSFYLSGGVLNEQFTVTIQVTDTNSEVSNDTILFQIIAP